MAMDAIELPTESKGQSFSLKSAVFATIKFLLKSDKCMQRFIVAIFTSLKMCQPLICSSVLCEAFRIFGNFSECQRAWEIKKEDKQIEAFIKFWVLNWRTPKQLVANNLNWYRVRASHAFLLNRITFRKFHRMPS